MREPGQQGYNLEDAINLRDYILVLRRNGWKILSLSLAVGVITLFIMFLMPNIYRSTAIIAPAAEDQKTLPSIASISSSFGIQIGSPSEVEDLEVLFNSNDLTVRVFRKYNLWPVVFPDDFDPKTGQLKVTWMDRLRGEKGDYKDPGDWDAIRVSEESLNVSANKKRGTLSISFDSSSPESSANITKYYLEEAKSRLQEEALERAMKNKQFIEVQIQKTVDALTRDRLYTLYGQEVEGEMLARNREQFGFTVIDSPRIPDRKAGPHRAIGAVIATMATFFLLAALFLLLGKHGGKS